ncbi:MAG: peptide-methionine (R)-S-oxide reductase MsrB [Kiritimatiellia bacterium]|nr:peptide-methionine (R)-S-oxide reductase MsrB [Kiritimatiellia bacterium]MDP6629852.1 peptide-methionine (R)-S-oxide reductase MsrB [Kiritimatiellia bacterium]MDP6809725.1 peptide-methionine (R)-S-oxide reductase MsrB [Kiritimatiellia bacterium]MDP7025165.1 peptide-methionine (R)-S-oxide reductase MsrB [Kiritimatiellia bacterium]
MTTSSEKTDAQWREQLTPMQYRVLRQAGTEPAGTGELLHNKKTGTYTCSGCGVELFTSDEKYDSGCGWPSFWQTSHATNITEHVDNSHGMRRIEVICSNCGGHLGHVFEDGPQPTGQRYCINSVSLGFEEEK